VLRNCLRPIQVSEENRPPIEGRFLMVTHFLVRPRTTRSMIRELEFPHRRRAKEVAAFATHQPNPRLVALLAKNLELHWNDFPWLPIRAGIWVRLLARRLCTSRLRLASGCDATAARYLWRRLGRGCYLRRWLSRFRRLGRKLERSDIVFESCLRARPSFEG